MSVSEVDAEAELEAAGIEGIAWHGEVVVSEPSLVHMAPEYEETCAVELGGDVSVAEGIVAHFRAILQCEYGGCGLVGIAVVAGVVVAVHAYLHLEHPEGAEAEIHVGIYAQCRKRQGVLVGAGLIGEGVVPVPYTEMQFLMQSRHENVY